MHTKLELSFTIQSCLCVSLSSKEKHNVCIHVCVVRTPHKSSHQSSLDESCVFRFFFASNRTVATNHLSFVCACKWLEGGVTLMEDIIFRYYNMRDYNCPPTITWAPLEAL